MFGKSSDNAVFDGGRIIYIYIMFFVAVFFPATFKTLYCTIHKYLIVLHNTPAVHCTWSRHDRVSINIQWVVAVKRFAYKSVCCHFSMSSFCWRQLVSDLIMISKCCHIPNFLSFTSQSWKSSNLVNTVRSNIMNGPHLKDNICTATSEQIANYNCALLQLLVNSGELVCL